MGVFQDLIQLSKQLLPTGRAFRISQNGVNEKLNNAIRQSETDVFNSALGVLDTILPDNENFTTEDATRWEQRLGLIVNENVPLPDRMDAIKRKMNHPGTILARQSAGYIQDQLQAAGFNVWVHENIPETDPGVFFGLSLSGIAEHSEDVEHMETGMEHGELDLWPDVVANDLNWQNEQYFDPGVNLKSVIYIGGQTAGTFASILSERRQEFRQLILKTKPTQVIAYLGINYI